MVDQDDNRTEAARLEAQGTPASAEAEARAAPRFTLLVRTAKLVIDGREYLSVLRDVSTTGCKVRLFHPLPLNAQEVALESAVGERFPMDLVWQRDDHAGFHFHNEIDVNRLIHDYHGDYPKRQIRLRTDVPAMVVAGSRDIPVVLRDISQSGACIECGERLMLRQPLRIEVAGFPSIYAKVCWRQAPRHGLVFDKGFLLEELARHMNAMHSAPRHLGSLRQTG